MASQWLEWIMLSLFYYVHSTLSLTNYYTLNITSDGHESRVSIVTCYFLKDFFFFASAEGMIFNHLFVNNQNNEFN